LGRIGDSVKEPIYIKYPLRDILNDIFLEDTSIQQVTFKLVIVTVVPDEIERLESGSIIRMKF
jgi:hypothetical protein